MSSLYLVSRHRLDDVTDWVPLGTAVMFKARTRKGLSYESAARLIPCASKTYERWEKRGEVPRPALPAVAAALGLEIEEDEPQRVTVAAPATDLVGLHRQLAAEVDRFARLNAQMERRLQANLEPAPSRRKRAGKG